MTEFATVFNQMLKATGKSIQEVSYISGVDAAYARRLASGEKQHPSPETVLKLWVGLVFCTDLIQKYPTMIEGFAELLQAAAMTSASFKAVDALY